MDLIKTTINRNLSKGIPVLANFVRLTNLFAVNPLLGFANIADIPKDLEIVRILLDTTNADTQQILRDLSNMVDTLIGLLTSIMSNPQG